MIFNHKVKHNGVTYPAGVDVPVGNAPAEIKEEKVGNTLSATEEGIIEIYRSLPKDKQKELFNFINAMR